MAKVLGLRLEVRSRAKELGLGDAWTIGKGLGLRL